MNILLQKIRRAAEIWKTQGWLGISNHLRNSKREIREKRKYQLWLKRHKIIENDRQKIRREIENLTLKPLISIVLPVYNVEGKWLRLCLESVFKQLYGNWQLCIADDKSPAPHIKKILEEFAAKDERIKIVFRAENGHISAASNSALELATGEFCVLLDHDDELSEDALFYLAKEINEFPETAFVYSDEDMIDAQGVHYYPKFKPDFSRDLLYSLNLITHLSAYKTEMLRKIGGFKIGLEGSQDYDLALRFIEQIDERQIRHIPRILYHWRAISGSVALSGNEKPYAHERAREALREHFERTGKKAKVEQGLYQFHRVCYELPEKLPCVSLILSANEDFEAAKQQVERLLAETDYQDLEIVLIAAGNLEKPTFSDSVKVIFPGNLSKAEFLNRAVLQSTGEILCFADARLRPLSRDWLKELVSFAVQKEIGAVGGKILDKNETISGGGFVFGFDDLIGTAFHGLPRETDWNLSRARVINNFSAVSAQCMAIRRAIFDETGGFDAENLPNTLFDADLCLKLGEKNRRIVFTPYAELIQTEKSDLQTNLSAKENEYFRQKWRKIIEKDPFYNPNLSPTGETFTIKL